LNFQNRQRFIFNQTQEEFSMNSIVQRIALVTGANKGIGFEIARQIAQAGTKVLMGARDADRGTAAADKLSANGLDVDFIQIAIDVAASVAATAAKIAADHGATLVLENADTAKIYGLGAEIRAQLKDNFEINANASWLHGRFNDYVSADAARPIW
jgi:NAD(P)-dependent dehydrogenase (short-subunit alcohol dehydrogenase family)